MFIMWNQLPIEICYYCPELGTKQYFVRAGSFFGSRFTIKEQLGNLSKVVRFSTRQEQRIFVENLASLECSFIDERITVDDDSNRIDFHSKDNLINYDYSSNVSPLVNDNEETMNYKNIIQLYLIDRIIKDGVDPSAFWSMIDTSKLTDGVKAFMNAIQKQRYAEERERLSAIDSTDEVIELRDGTTLAAFPALCKHGIPLTVSSIHAILRDIVNLSQKAINIKLLTLRLFNGKVCSLIQVPFSRNFYHFTR
jgi:hypothetical protein